MLEKEEGVIFYDTDIKNFFQWVGGVKTPVSQGEIGLPLTVITASTVVTESKSFIADPSAGNIMVTLPDSATNPGMIVYLKRSENSGNLVELETTGGDVFESEVGFNSFPLGSKNDYVRVETDGSGTWFMTDRRTFSFGAIQRPVSSGTTTQALTTSYAIFDAFDTNAGESPGKLVVDVPNNEIDVILVQQASIGDFYRVNFDVVCEFTNGQNVTFEVFYNDLPTGILGTQEGRGPGDAININAYGFAGVVSLASFDLRAKVQTNGTMTIVNCSMVVERIGG
jgi:hypothetical protein